MKNFREIIDSIPENINRQILLQGDLAIKIGNIIDSRGWSVSDASKVIGISKSYLEKILSGQANMTLSIIAKIEMKLNIKLLIVPGDICY